MHKDLAQISNAQGIYRTLALLSILSPMSDIRKNVKHSSPGDSPNESNNAEVDAKTEAEYASSSSK
jgi:hypothetical protein